MWSVWASNGVPPDGYIYPLGYDWVELFSLSGILLPGIPHTIVLPTNTTPSVPAIAYQYYAVVFLPPLPTNVFDSILVTLCLP